MVSTGKQVILHGYLIGRHTLTPRTVDEQRLALLALSTARFFSPAYSGSLDKRPQAVKIHYVHVAEIPSYRPM